MNKEELKLLEKIEELPKELNMEIRGLILAEVCLREENQQLKDIINKANKKIDNMFDVGYENKIIDDLLELQKILDNKGVISNE